ncbi:MAG TPA: hypothetical protein IAC90_03745 [Candidatus Coproplasma stercorigallinarum]|nr:hypothetical protein [Candidatus Coproplasma stercorigallinarum]
MSRATLMQKVAKIAFILLTVAMLFLLFSNDFGLVDIHKASIVVAVGVDVTESGYEVTAQAAVPTPAQGEGSAAYTQVTGEGVTVAEAVDDINAKTGFYPKLAFCNLVILGENCKDSRLFTVLDYFYRNDYVPLTALVAMCRGSAKELLGQKPADGGMSSSAIQRAMSEELKNSANASTINLKLLAQDANSPSASAYMPFIESSQDGSGGATTASSGGSSGSSSGSSGGQAKRGGNSAEFTCRTTAAFSDGGFAGVLDEEQAFALNLLRSQVRLAIVNAVYEGVDYTVGLKNNSCTMQMAVEGGIPVLTVRYRALANVQSSKSRPAAEGSANSHLVDEGVLRAVSGEIEECMRSLESFCTQNGCDLFGAERMLYQRFYSDYQLLKGGVLPVLKVKYDIKINSVH